MHGLENDFVIILLDEETSITPRMIQNLSNRKTGIGCDLVVFLKNNKTDLADVSALFYNADGSEAQICGNALRCIGKFFFKKLNKKNIVVETNAGFIDLEEVRDKKISVDMGVPKFDWQKIPLSANLDTRNLHMSSKYLNDGFALNLGNPHLIFFVDELDSRKLSPNFLNIAKQPIFPDGINISAVKVLSRDRISILTFERGVGLTHACGSGACASVIASNKLNFCDKSVNVLMKGGELVIEISDDNHIFMIGHAEEVFEGQVDITKFKKKNEKK